MMSRTILPKSRVGLVAVLVTLLCAAGACADDYRIDLSTYLGGNGDHQGRGIAADNTGNIYVVGDTAAADFPIRNGTAVNTQPKTDPACGQNMDAFVAKFAPTGQLLWSTALGGPNYDRAYDVHVDPKGNVYVGGRGGWGFPVTRNAFQPKFCGGGGADVYGHSEAWIAKLNPSGRVLWASWVGHSSNARSIALDGDGNVYMGIVYDPKLPDPGWHGPAAFANAYQKTPRSSGDQGVVKISSDGTTVKWATWLSGSADGSASAGAIKVDGAGNVYLLSNTTSTNLVVSTGAAQATNRGKSDLYLARLSPDGSKLLYGTYFGGSDDEYNETHNLAVDRFGNAYVAVTTKSPDLPTTEGAFQRTFKGKSDWGVAKFSPTGSLLGCTYIGGIDMDLVDGVSADDHGNVYMSGSTMSADFPVTANAFQKTRALGTDAVFVKLKADFSALEYGTFIGGPANELGRCSDIDGAGKFYMIGQTNGTGWPTINAFQAACRGGMNVIIVRFVPVRGR